MKRILKRPPRENDPPAPRFYMVPLMWSRYRWWALLLAVAVMFPLTVILWCPTRMPHVDFLSDFVVQALLGAVAVRHLWANRKMIIWDKYKDVGRLSMIKGDRPELVPFGRYLVHVEGKKGDLIRAVIYSSPLDVVIEGDETTTTAARPGFVKPYTESGERTVLLADARYLSTEAMIVDGKSLCYLEPEGVIGLFDSVKLYSIYSVPYSSRIYMNLDPPGETDDRQTGRQPMKPQELTEDQQELVDRLRAVSVRLCSLRERRDAASAVFSACLAAAVGAGVGRVRLASEVGLSIQSVDRRLSGRAGSEAG